jgi:isoquinoline 1-oxidoreductase alpha subunit
MQINVNGVDRAIETERGPEALLWWLRDDLGLSGARHGCGEGACGACLVLLDGLPVPSCVVPCAAAAGRRVSTVESLAADHPVRRAWRELDVAQCGYCQNGQMMGAAALLARRPRPSDADIDAAMARHLCRCGTYVRIRAAIHRAAALAAPAR